MKQIVLKATGMSPVLLHSTGGMKVQVPGGVKRREIPTPEEEAEAGTYRDADGDLCLPTTGFRAGALNAASGLKVGKLTARRALGAFFPLQELTKLLNPETDEIISEYEIDIRPAVVGTARIMRSRARVERWSVIIECEYDEGIIDEESILDLLNRAGRLSGIGDYRVQCSGTFGRYTVKKV